MKRVVLVLYGRNLEFLGRMVDRSEKRMESDGVDVGTYHEGVLVWIEEFKIRGE